LSWFWTMKRSRHSSEQSNSATTQSSQRFLQYNLGYTCANFDLELLLEIFMLLEIFIIREFKLNFFIDLLYYVKYKNFKNNQKFSKKIIKVFYLQKDHSHLESSLQILRTNFSKNTKSTFLKSNSCKISA
jgi:hypothetical protein